MWRCKQPCIDKYGIGRFTATTTASSATTASASTARNNIRRNNGAG